MLALCVRVCVRTWSWLDALTHAWRCLLDSAIQYSDACQALFNLVILHLVIVTTDELKVLRWGSDSPAKALKWPQRRVQRCVLAARQAWRLWQF